MRPQKRLNLSRRAAHRRKLVACVCVAAFLLICLLLSTGKGGGVVIVTSTSSLPLSTSSNPLLTTDSSRPAGEQAKTPTALLTPFLPADTPPREAGLNLPTRAWVDVEDDISVYATPQHIVTESAADGLAMVFPFTPFHTRTPESVTHFGGSPASAWEGLTMPKDRLSVPSWASVDEANVLRHATIFVSLASYRDPECGDTLTALFDHAMSPHRIYVGISEERTHDDADCLRLLDGHSDAEVASTLWGQPQGVTASTVTRGVFWKRDVRWTDIVRGPAPVPIVTTDEAVAAQLNGTLNASTPPGAVFLLPRYEEEVMTCVGGRHERARDMYVLNVSGGVRPAASGSHSLWMRQGKGGAQQRPSAALAGCRVVRRLASPSMARGPTFGRYVTSLFYMNQDYYMVVDSHSRFSVDWDAKMIRRVFQNPTPGVLSHYPNGYTPEKPEGEYTKRDVMTMCRGQVLANAMPKLGAMWMPVRPYNVLQAFAAAGYMFGDAQFALDAPFDPFLPYLFDGEEILYSGRLWTTGWDIYGPGEPNIFHHYGRPKTPKFWERVRAEEQRLRTQSERRALFLLHRFQPWVQVLEDAMRHYNETRARVSGVSSAPFTPPPYVPGESRPVVTEAEALANPALSVLRGYYGMGNKRTLSAYWQYCQMDDDKVVERDNEHRWMSGNALCDDAIKPRR